MVLGSIDTDKLTSDNINWVVQLVTDRENENKFNVRVILWEASHLTYELDAKEALSN